MLKKLLFVFALIALIGCSKDDVYQLTVINNVENLENFAITEVKLAGNEFKDLSVGIGESITLTLDETAIDYLENIPSGLFDLLFVYQCGVRSWGRAAGLLFEKNMTITVSQTFSGGGCTDIEFN
jgi:hypothetical protein